MPRTRHLFLPLVLALCACSPVDEAEEIGQAVDFPFAAYHADCAPWDGAAIVLYLTHGEVTEVHVVPYPHVAVSLYNDASSLLGTTVEWRGRDSELGYAAQCESAGSCAVAESVLVHLDEVAPDGQLLGRLRLRFADGDSVSGTFSASRIPFQPLCG